MSITMWLSQSTGKGLKAALRTSMAFFSSQCSWLLKSASFWRLDAQKHRGP